MTLVSLNVAPDNLNDADLAWLGAAAQYHGLDAPRLCRAIRDCVVAERHRRAVEQAAADTPGCAVQPPAPQPLVFDLGRWTCLDLADALTAAAEMLQRARLEGRLATLLAALDEISMFVANVAAKRLRMIA